MEYIDLSPYEYRTFPLPMRSIGWLGSRYGIQGLGVSSMGSADLTRLRSASVRPGSITLGVHRCEFCKTLPVFEGNGEYHYYSQSGTIYSAPTMILHYIEVHKYKPPREFLNHLRGVGRLQWDWRSEYLAGIIEDETEDPDFRGEAIIDISNWRDRRVVDTLVRATRDSVLVDFAGDEIGRSLRLLAKSGLVEISCIDNLPDIVRLGINQTEHA